MALIDIYQFKKKTLVSIAGLLIAVSLVVFSVYLLFDYLSTGEVNITTSNDAEIYSVAIKEGQYKNILLGKSKYTARLKPGAYTFLAKIKDSSTIQTIEVRSRKSNDINMKILEISEPKKIINVYATDIQASGKEIRYVNSSYNYLETYTLGSKSPKNYPIPESTQNITDAQWIGDKKALLRLGNRLTALLDNSRFLEFNPLPRDPRINNVDIEPVLNQIIMNSKMSVLSQIDSSIYYQANISSDPKQLIENVNSEGLVFDLANNGMYAYAKTYDLVDPSDTVEASSKKSDKNIYIGNAPDSKPFKTIEAKEDVTFMKFSPNSKKLAYTNNLGLFVYDTISDTNTLVYTKQPEKAQLTIWVGDDKLIFIDNSGMWLMDVNELVANNITLPVLANSAVALTISEDGKTAYFTTQNSSLTGVSSVVYSLDTQSK